MANPALAIQYKLKVQLKLAISRLRMIQQKGSELAKQQRREIALLLEQGRVESARIRIESIIHSDLMTELHEFIELYCELLLARLPQVFDPELNTSPPGTPRDISPSGSRCATPNLVSNESKRSNWSGKSNSGGGNTNSTAEVSTTDRSLEEAMATLIHAAPRCNIKELQVVRALLMEVLGRDKAGKAARGTGCAARVLRKLRQLAGVPPPALVSAYVCEIAHAYEVSLECLPDQTDVGSTGFCAGNSLNVGGASGAGTSTSTCINPNSSGDTGKNGGVMTGGMIMGNNVGVGVVGAAPAPNVPTFPLSHQLPSGLNGKRNDGGNGKQKYISKFKLGSFSTSRSSPVPSIMPIPVVPVSPHSHITYGAPLSHSIVPNTNSCMVNPTHDNMLYPIAQVGPGNNKVTMSGLYSATGGTPYISTQYTLPRTYSTSSRLSTQSLGPGQYSGLGTPTGGGSTSGGIAGQAPLGNGPGMYTANKPSTRLSSSRIPDLRELERRFAALKW